MSHTRFEPVRPRLHRSELAVPGSAPAMFPKALESEADYVFLDLEDAVAPADKEQARKNVLTGLQEFDWRGRGKTISVRINGIDTHYMYPRPRGGRGTGWARVRPPSSCRRSASPPTCISSMRC